MASGSSQSMRRHEPAPRTACMVRPTCCACWTRPPAATSDRSGSSWIMFGKSFTTATRTSATAKAWSSPRAVSRLPGALTGTRTCATGRSASASRTCGCPCAARGKSSSGRPTGRIRTHLTTTRTHPRRQSSSPRVRSTSIACGCRRPSSSTRLASGSRAQPALGGRTSSGRCCTCPRAGSGIRATTCRCAWTATTRTCRRSALGQRRGPRRLRRLRKPSWTRSPT
mmetsp:Transcript_115498/g.333653  ORF Transcript_115498/g.333653 Transcript_115498/m.333653 type:complete len:226 (-) Transcript_115498:1156-1833(-)